MKKLSFLLIILAVSANFTACNRVSPMETIKSALTTDTVAVEKTADTTISRDKECHLSNEKYKEINQAWLLEENVAISWEKGRYYGTYHGYIVLFWGTQLYVESHVRVGETVISHPTSFILRAYKNGKFYELHELFQTGGLYQEDILAIKYCHDSYVQ